MTTSAKSLLNQCKLRHPYSNPDSTTHIFSMICTRLMPAAKFSKSCWLKQADFANNVFPWRNSSMEAAGRRVSKSKAKSVAGQDPTQTGFNVTGDPEAVCAFSWIAPPAERVLSCVTLMAMVSGLRVLVCVVIKHCFRKQVPVAFFFPCWEGPVLLAEYLALCDAIFTAAASLCDWHIGLAIVLLVSCPLMLIIIPIVSLRRYIAQHKDEVYPVRTRRESLGQFTKKFAKANGVKAKLAAAYLYFEQMEAKGDWNDQDPKIRFWSWLLSDYTQQAWFYGLWLMVKRIWMSACTILADGAVNATMALVCQMLDSIIVLWMQPFNEFSTQHTKSLGELMNALSIFVLSVPALFGVAAPEWLGDMTKLCLAFAATAIAAISSLIAPIRLVFMQCYKLLQPCCGISGGAVVSAGMSERGAEVAKVAGSHFADEANDELQVRVHDKLQMAEGATTAAHAAMVGEGSTAAGLAAGAMGVGAATTVNCRHDKHAREIIIEGNHQEIIVETNRDIRPAIIVAEARARALNKAQGWGSTPLLRKDNTPAPGSTWPPYDSLQDWSTPGNSVASSRLPSLDMPIPASSYTPQQSRIWIADTYITDTSAFRSRSKGLAPGFFSDLANDSLRRVGIRSFGASGGTSGSFNAPPSGSACSFKTPLTAQSVKESMQSAKQAAVQAVAQSSSTTCPASVAEQSLGRQANLHRYGYNDSTPSRPPSHFVPELYAVLPSAKNSMIIVSPQTPRRDDNSKLGRS